MNGEPGVYSARYAGEHCSANDNMEKLLNALTHQSNRNAWFKTVIALNLDSKSYLFEGTVNGEITLEKSGLKGFGYDPIFKPNGYDHTFAELPLETKNRISHRGIAMRHLMNLIRKLSYEKK